MVRSTIFFTFILATVWLVPIFTAESGYVKLGESTIFNESGSYTGSTSNPQLLGSFTPTKDIFIEAGTSTARFTYTNTSVYYQSCDGAFYVTIRTSPISGAVVATYHDQNLLTTLGQSKDVNTSTVNNAILKQGQTYYVFAHSQCNPGNFIVEDVSISGTELVKQPNPTGPTTFFIDRGTYRGSVNSPQLLGSFTPTDDFSVKAGTSTARFTYTNTSGFPGCSNSFYITIQTSPFYGGTIVAYHDEYMTTPLGLPKDIDIPSMQSTTLNKGQTYYVFAHSQCNPGNFVVEDISIATNEAGQSDEIDPLLLQYAPILYFHEDEDYYPMNVEVFVEDSALWSTDGFGDTLLIDDDNLTFNNFELYVANNHTTDHYLAYSAPDQAKTIKLDVARTKYNNATASGRATTTVYVHKMTDGYTDSQGVQHDFVVLQYWFFYAMNNWGEVGGRNNHEGDWESVFVFLDPLTEEPKYVAYSSHLNDGDSDDSVFQYESVRRKWNEIEKEGSQARSYIARGSHANYPHSGEFDARDYTDDTTPAEKHQTFNNFIGITDDTSIENWLSYEGKWGTDKILPGFDGPQGPRYTNPNFGGGVVRFERPVKWAGIDKYEELTTTQSTSQIAVSTAQFSFATPIPAGTTVSADQYDEFVSFGINLGDIDLLPHFYDFESSLGNSLPTTTITLAYDPAEVNAFGVIAQDLTGFYYNESTGAWEALSSIVDTQTSTVSFITGHFSRYAIGAKKWVDVTDSVSLKQHWGKYDPKTATREAALTITGDPDEQLRVLVSDITAAGTYLSNNTGVTPEDEQFIEVETNEDGVAEVILVFNVPPKEAITTENGEITYVPDELKFDFRITIQKKSPLDLY